MQEPVLVEYYSLMPAGYTQAWKRSVWRTGISAMVVVLDTICQISSWDLIPGSAQKVCVCSLTSVMFSKTKEFAK